MTAALEQDIATLEAPAIELLASADDAEGELYLGQRAAQPLQWLQSKKNCTQKIETK